VFGASFAKRDAILGRVTCLWRPFMMLCGMLTVCGVLFAELDAILGRVTCLWRPFYDAMWDASLFVASSLLSLILSLEALLSKKKATALVRVNSLLTE